MADELTSTGLTIDTLATRLARIKAAIRSTISNNLNLSPSTPWGQFIGILCEEIQSVLELLQEVHTAFDPDQATGNTLSVLAALTGTTRQEATAGTVTLTLNLDASTTVPAGSIAAVSTDNTNRWATDSATTSTGAGDYPAAATCTQTGSIQALAGTITDIVTPVAGWNTVTNASDATTGQDEATDTELRLAREVEVSLPGSSTTSAIAAQISSDVPEIISLVVEENTSWQSQNGMPPKSIEVIIWDGSTPLAANADIVESIYSQKPAGIQAFGDTVVTHTDDEGNDHQIGFTRVTVRNILCDITLVTTGGTEYVGDTAVQQAIHDYIETTLSVGGDVRRSDIVRIVDGLTGVDYVDFSAGPLLSIKPAATAAQDILIARDEKAMVDVMATDISVTSS